jgi:pyridoxamine 5'-phosphate oxidase
MLTDQQLPDPLPFEPMALLAAWFAEALRRKDQPNPDAMVLATCDDGQPSARVVLCKDIEPATGSLRFFTNYESRKGRELAANPRAALVFHWDHLQRQARLEGSVDKTSAADSDSYFASRPRDSQIGAHASRQSEPIASLHALRSQADAGDHDEIPAVGHVHQCIRALQACLSTFCVQNQNGQSADGMTNATRTP